MQELGMSKVTVPFERGMQRTKKQLCTSMIFVTVQFFEDIRQSCRLDQSAKIMGILMRGLVVRNHIFRRQKIPCSAENCARFCLGSFERIFEFQCGTADHYIFSTGLKARGIYEETSKKNIEIGRESHLSSSVST